MTAKKSDYGDIFPELCEPGLRAEVAQSLMDARVNEKSLSPDQLNQVAAYIARLEDALVKHHTGELKSANVLESLKGCTGLDVSALAFSVESMFAEDA